MDTYINQSFKTWKVQGSKQITGFIASSRESFCGLGEGGIKKKEFLDDELVPCAESEERNTMWSEELSPYRRLHEKGLKDTI